MGLAVYDPGRMVTPRPVLGNDKEKALGGNAVGRQFISGRRIDPNFARFAKRLGIVGVLVYGAVRNRFPVPRAGRRSGDVENALTRLPLRFENGILRVEDIQAIDNKAVFPN